jgi:ribonuclease HII
LPANYTAPVPSDPNSQVLAQDDRSACGLDEVGRGALAGPLVAAAVVLPPQFTHPLLRDSKRLSPAQRERAALAIRAVATVCAVVEVGPAEIDGRGIGWANRWAFEQLMERVEAESFLVDGNLRLHSSRPYQSVVGGDAVVPAISAASIVAKVHRDRLMRDLDTRVPGYLWSQNKGYGSPGHMDALRRMGPSPYHRLSFIHLDESLPF